MEKDPDSMSNPLEGEDVQLLVDAFQELNSDSELDSPIDLAKSYKSKGNEAFCNGENDTAIELYTKGLNVKCEDNKLNAILYSNRAAAEYHRGNYNESLDDATSAKALDPQNFKALKRGALCYSELGQYEECISLCDEGLKSNAYDEVQMEELKELKKELLQKELSSLEKAIKKRGISIRGGKLGEEHLTSEVPRERSSRVCEIEEVLIWPVLLLYREYNKSDYIEKFDERTCFDDHLSVVFSETPKWDTEKKYIPKNLQVYFTGTDDKLVRVDKKQPLKEVLRHEKFELSCLTIYFIVLLSNSEFEKSYLAKVQN